MNNKKLILENGQVFYGQGFGSDDSKIAELVFNNSTVGYQEIISDASNYGKMMVFSYPLIGNTGMMDEDYESEKAKISAIIVREYNDVPTNFRYTKTLNEYMIEKNIAGIQGIDTRQLLKILTSKGTMKAMITDIMADTEECIKAVKNEKIKNFAGDISTKKIWYSRTKNPRFNVIAIDLGIRKSLIKVLNNYGCNVTVVPYNVDIKSILNQNFDGIIISNGSGNPYELQNVIDIVHNLQGEFPIYGEGLGCDFIALANGADVEKMKFGKHGANYPVRNIENGKIQITSQNHMYSIISDTIENLKPTHFNVFDNEIIGIMIKKKMIFGTKILNYENKNNETFNNFINIMQQIGGYKNAQEKGY